MPYLKCADGLPFISLNIGSVQIHRIAILHYADVGNPVVHEYLLEVFLSVALTVDQVHSLESAAIHFMGPAYYFIVVRVSREGVEYFNPCPERVLMPEDLKVRLTVGEPASQRVLGHVTDDEHGVLRVGDVIEEVV